MISKLIKLSKEESGATMVEYALIACFIAIVAVIGAALVGGSAFKLFDQSVNKMP